MVEESAQQWFLEIEGNRTGPFTTEQVLGLLADGELPDTQLLFTSANSNQFISLRDLASRHRVAPVAPPAQAPVQQKVPPAPKAQEAVQSHSSEFTGTGITRPFIPPPRPSESHPTSEPPKAP